MSARTPQDVGQALASRFAPQVAPSRLAPQTVDINGALDFALVKHAGEVATKNLKAHVGMFSEVDVELPAPPPPRVITDLRDLLQ